MTPTCGRCGALVRVSIERALGYLVQREVCAAGHSRDLGLVETVVGRPIVPGADRHWAKRSREEIADLMARWNAGESAASIDRDLGLRRGSAAAQISRYRREGWAFVRRDSAGRAVVA